MNDPPRLVRQRTLEGALLRATRRDASPARSRERMLSTLGIVATTAISTTAKTAAAAALANAKPAAVTSAFAAKWAIVGSVGALVTVGVVHEAPLWFSQGTRPTASSSSSSLKRMSESPKPKRHVPGRLELAETESVASAAPSLSAVQIPVRSARPAPTVRPPAIANLAAEVSAIDQARAAGEAHDPTRTLSLLDSYERQFPNGSLAPEAQLLRIEALVQQGQRAQALPIARRLLDAAPDGPLSERIHGLLPEID